MAEGDDKGFRWGLTPSGEPDPASSGSDKTTSPANSTTPADPPTPADPASPASPAGSLDRGHFEALHSDAATPVSQPDPSLGHEDIETQEFATQRPAFVAHPPYETASPPHEPPPLVDPAAQQHPADAPTTGLDAFSALGLTPPEMPETPGVPVRPSAPELPAATEAFAAPAFPVHPDAGQPPAVDASLPGSANALVAQPVGLGDAATGSNDLDSVFGASQFVEYVDAPLVPGSALQAREPRPPRAPVAPLSPTQKKLVWVAAGLVAAIVLVALYVVGTRIAPEPAPVAKPTPAASASPSPTPEPEKLGPVAAGTYAYNALLGTECVEPFGSAWEKEYSVVACDEPHSAQLVARGVFSDALDEPFPGVDALDARLIKRCASSRAIDYDRVADLNDLQVAASFAANETEWAAGNRDWFCFATRASGDKLATNIAKPDVAHLPTGD